MQNFDISQCYHSVVYGYGGDWVSRVALGTVNLSSYDVPVS